MTVRARPTAAAVGASLLLAGCTAGASAVDPQPCDQRLRTTSFEVCLPADASGVVQAPARSSATMGPYRVEMAEVDAQPGDPDQAAFAALDRLVDQVGSDLGVPVGPTGRPASVTLGREGPVELADADGAFEAVRTVFDTGDVDDVVAWGRGATTGDRAGAVVVVRDYDGAEVTARQAEDADAAAMPVVVTLRPAAGDLGDG